MQVLFDCIKYSKCINALHMRLLLHLLDKIIGVYCACDIVFCNNNEVIIAFIRQNNRCLLCMRYCFLQQ